MPLTMHVEFHGLMKLRREDAGKIQDIKRECLEAMAHDWHHMFYDHHFTAEGAASYRYGRRYTKDVTSGQIKRSKTGRPKAPNANPLMWSGRSYIAGRSYRVQATADRSAVIMRIPALNFHPRMNPTLRMRDEVTRVLVSEERYLARIAEDRLGKRLERFGERSVVLSKSGKAIFGASATKALAAGTATRSALKVQGHIRIKRN